MRKKPRSSRRTAAARTRSLCRPSASSRSRSTRLRIRGSLRAKRSISSNFSWSRRSRQRRWYRYCLRPRASIPVAWMWPPGYGQIHTSSQAGGMTRSLMRARTSVSVTRSPSGSTMLKPRPRRTRRSPGPPVSARRRRIVGLFAAIGRVGLPALRRLRALRGRLLGRRLLLGLLLAAAADLVEARLQRGHQVRHRGGFLLGHRLDGDLLAGRLALDEREDLLAVGVLVLVRLERA